MELVAELNVVGLPAPQGSKSRMPNGAILEGKSAAQRLKHKSWRGAVEDAARAWVAEHNAAPFDGPLAVTIQFRFPLPASDPHRTRHTTQPDIDKIQRSTFDALKLGGLIHDDARIFQSVTSKTYARGDSVGAHILVVSHAAAEAVDREESKAAARGRIRRGAA